MVAKTAILIIVHNQCVLMLQILNSPFIQLRQIICPFNSLIGIEKSLKIFNIAERAEMTFGLQ